MSENVFNLCVTMLLEMAEWTGLSYKQINVLIFCILWPIVTVALCWSNMKLRHRLRSSTAD